MSTSPGSTFDAIAFTSLGPEEPDELEPDPPELPVLPELPKVPPNGDPLPEPLLPFPKPEPPERNGNWPPEADAADWFDAPEVHAAWPMPTPATRSRAAAPPAKSALRTRWSDLPTAEAPPAPGVYQDWAEGWVGGPANPGPPYGYPALEPGP